jgi:hypothetical protein
MTAPMCASATETPVRARTAAAVSAECVSSGESAVRSWFGNAQAYPTRAVIERVISWTAVQNGRRVKLRYLGDRKNDAWLQHRCAAINLRTLVNAGLTRSSGAWAIT